MFAILQSLAKTETLALVGADVYTLHTTRNKVNRGGTEGCHASPVTQPKFRIPARGTPPSNDVYGRPYIVPEWVVKSENLVFLEALQMCMSLVNICFNLFIVNLTSSPGPQCPAIKNVNVNQIMQATKSYLNSLKKHMRTQTRYIPKDWVFREDPNAAVRDRNVSTILHSLPATSH